MRVLVVSALGCVSVAGASLGISADAAVQRRAHQLPATSVPVTAAAPALADDVAERKKKLDQDIADLRDSLEGSNADFVSAAVALKTAQENLINARADLAAAQAALAEAVAQDADLASRLTFAQAEQVKAEKQLAEQAQDAEQTKRTLGQMARQAYVGGGNVSSLDILLRAEDAQSLSDRMAYAGAALRAQNGTIDRLAVLQAEMRARQLRLSAVRDQVAALKRQSEAVLAQRKAAEAAATTAEAQVRGLVTQQAAALTAVQAKVAAEKRQLAAMTAEQDQLKAVLAARARAAAEKAAEEAKNRHPSSNSAGSSGEGDAPAASGGLLAQPSNARISSGYGMRYHPILHYSRLHSGTDFASACGSPVYAAADGTIIQAGWGGGYGNRVVIDHGWLGGAHLATTYNHLTRFVRHGGQVDRGDLIAYSGTTGLSTGCHLHFEVLRNGSFTNPVTYF